MTAPSRSPRQDRKALQSLDPAADLPLTRPERLTELASQITGPPTVDGDAHEGRPPRRRPLVIVLAAVVVAVIGVGAGVIISGQQHPTQILAVPAAPADTSAHRAVVEASPLAADRSVDCNDVPVPATLFAAAGSAERGTSESSVALRSFLNDNPWQDTSPVTGTDWLLLSASDRRLVFGQRTGPVGIGDVVTLVRTGGRWQASDLESCGLVIPAPGEQAERIESASLHGSDLQLRWSIGMCEAPSAENLPPVETTATASGLHALIIIRALGAPIGCAGGVASRTSHVQLSRPLNVNFIRDDSSVPSRLVELQR